MLYLAELRLLPARQSLADLPEGKLMVNTLNAHSFNVAQQDDECADAFRESDVLLPDGASIVKACHWLKINGSPVERVSGWDYFEFEMEKLAAKGGRCFFLGSNEDTLEKIRHRVAMQWPSIVVGTFSPSYSDEFSERESRAMVEAVNSFDPDLLWVGMTAPKQEKWTRRHWEELDIHCHCGNVGAVFDFYAGNARRAPEWWQNHSIEWLYRLCCEPKRMWRRYLLGNPKFIYLCIKEKLK